ncbi:GNAT family N-acetyltransferase [Vibrio diazotrophicus]|jgi:predicted GNAT family N-acyltransferase|uniref:N-acetyltransferase n=1 Tax=Vibrio diazotrophicus TaxID=685 RepID=A0ABX4W8F5_VIBDI|nr:GNAT family N-acetyltransferase [Vibrio diazotrophicus]PNH90590.1 N-acetyltransferase [Vibrio diazotrophicus]PNH99835.1 N-acetyltransferase [Vibrio diazotrophicus]
MDSDISILLEAPSAEEFITLRETANWKSPSLVHVTQSIQNSLFHVTIRTGKDLIAMARIVGDGVMYFYIQDVVVSPNHRQKGLGSILMQEIERYLEQNAPSNATVGLLAATGKESFYERYGYVIRPTEALGHGMCKFT